MESVLELYLGIDSQGYLEFKYIIKHSIDSNKISKKEALYIMLELLYLLRTHKIKRIAEISLNISKLTNGIKSGDKAFNKSYSSETLIIEKFINNLLKENNIDDNAVIDSNHDFINSNNDFISFKAPESKSSTNYYESPKRNSYSNYNSEWQYFEYVRTDSKIGRKEIKEYLRDFDKNELCEILSLNPNLIVQKEKTLRNRVVEEIINSNLDLEELIELSKNDFKKEINNINSIKKEKIAKETRDKKTTTKLLHKIKEFNNKSIMDMISSRGDFTHVYTDAVKFGVEGNEFLIFKYYLNNMDKLNQLMDLQDEIANQSASLEELYDFIDNSGYLPIKSVNALKSKYSQVHSLISLEEYPKPLREKFIRELDSYSYFEFLNDLYDYDGLYGPSKDNLIKKHNEKILDSEINNNEEFFKNITDINKKRAIVVDEDNVRVLAGAGTGKTFTIQKKVKYLIEKQDVDPEKILCLCYTNKGASELDNKVNKELTDSKVEVCTFHEFCRRVDRYCGGNKSTNRYLLDYVIRNYIKDIVDDPQKISKLTEYFSYYITPPLEREEFDNYDELIELEEGKKLATLKDKYYHAKYPMYTFNGDYVKSIGELIIANYLFMHEIEYEYEINYKHSFKDVLKRFLYSGKFLSLNEIAEESNKHIVDEFIKNELKWERYNPDFYLPKYDIYLEHFGIGRENNDLWLPPYYEKEMKDKILCHKLHGTKLIKTYYCYLEDGHLIEKLEELLKENDVVIGQKDQNEILDVLIATNELNDYKDFNKLIKTFINIFEAQNKQKSAFDEFKKQANTTKNGYTRKRQQIFFDIISDIYDSYYEYNQKETIDHNREVSNALELIESKKYDKSYEYILIDEYQDINYIRCKLLQELQKNTNCKIFVVGDDWQSIYRFNGSDVNLFINFDEYFPNSLTVKLEENRRNTQKLIDISSDFIQKNENQEKKDLCACKNEYLPNLNPIKIVPFDWYSRKGKNRILKLDAILTHIFDNSEKDKLEILLLGRKNKDINKITGNNLFKEKKEGKYRKIIYSKKRDADITFMTIHQAKGLEYDEVIILNFENHISGFPNQIEDDPLLNFVKEKEDYKYAEERRLLYVALTRTLNNVYLLAPDVEESVFIEELRDDFGVEEIILPIDEDMEYHLYDDSDFFEKMQYIPTKLTCPHCDGKITLMINNERNTKYFRCSNDLKSNSHHFDGGPYYGKIEDLKYVEKCPSCRGMLIRNGDVLKCCLNSHYGCMESKELDLDDEDLEYDE